MLIDELKLLAERAGKTGCVVGVWLQNQDKEFQEVLDVLKKSPSLNISETLVLIRKYYPELPFKRTSFSTHMKGTCQCPIA
jgi:hypothetical protein